MTERQKIIERIEEIMRSDMYKELESLYDKLEEMEYDKIHLSNEQVNKIIRVMM